MNVVNKSYITLMIGNSRLHWAWFVGSTLQEAWDTNHLSVSQVQQLTRPWASGIMPGEIFPSQLVSRHSPDSQLPLYLASVVPAQTKLWQTYLATQVITLEDVPLSGLYPTLGIDRALALLGAGETYGYPILVIDAGTALTFTGVNSHRHLIGGAILPGLGLQLKSLTQQTATLPSTQLPLQLPTRWAVQTSTAIESGVLYTILAGIRDFITDWRRQFPESPVVLTGGDSGLLLHYLQTLTSSTLLNDPEAEAQKVISDSHLIFWGISFIVRLRSAQKE